MKRTVGLEQKQLIWKVCMETMAMLHPFHLEIVTKLLLLWSRDMWTIKYHVS